LEWSLRVMLESSARQPEKCYEGNGEREGEDRRGRR
jgi:hypothetical protein